MSDSVTSSVAAAMPSSEPVLKRVGFFAYGSVCYLIFGGVFAYAVPFVGGFGVSKTIDSGVATPTVAALLINVGLLSVFALQHSVMARPTFKRWWTEFVPQPIERATYVLATNAAMILLFWQWRPMGGIVWDVSGTAAGTGLWALYGGAWLLILVATIQINHFDLFGMRQVWLYLNGKPYTNLPFATPLFYKYIRHPLYLGWILAFWATPTMTAGHLLFALVTTAYLFVAIQFEERNLVEHFGAKYRSYREEVPMILPVPGKRAGVAVAARRAAA